MKSFLPLCFLAILLHGILASCNDDDCSTLNPEISDITETAFPGDTIRIYGKDFSDATEVLLNDVLLPIVSVERYEILAIVPDDAGSGPILLKDEEAPEFPPSLTVYDPGWRRAGMFTEEYPHTMLFAPEDPQTGWLIGRRLFQTTDGGINWQQLPSSFIEGNPFVSIQAVNATQLFVLTTNYRQYLLKSENSGRDWTPVPLPEGSGEPVAMHFTSEKEGTILIESRTGGETYSTFYHTLDGGENWTAVFSRRSIDYNGWFSRETTHESWFISSYYQKAYKISAAGVDSVDLPPLIEEGSPVLFSATGEAWAAGLPEGFHSQTVGGTDEWVTAEPCLLWSSDNGGKLWQKAVLTSKTLLFHELKAMSRAGNSLWGLNSGLDIVRFNIADQQAQLRSIPQTGFFPAYGVDALHLMENGRALLLADGTLFRYLPGN